MKLSYEKIFSRFLSKIDDIPFLALDQTDAYSHMNTWLHAAAAKPWVSKTITSLALFDDIMVLTGELDTASGEASDEEFALEALALGMVAEWLLPKVNATVTIAPLPGTVQGEFQAQTGLLRELRALFDNTVRIQKELIEDRDILYAPKKPEAAQTSG